MAGSGQAGTETPDLERFVVAQDAVMDRVRTELDAGLKRSHWMWFVFPQLASLGRSDRARYYGLLDLGEAAAYLAHPLLGPRLVDCASRLLAHRGVPPEAIFGSVDTLKLRSSMTLFAAVPGADAVFAAVLEAFFGGTPCALTQAAVTGS